MLNGKNIDKWNNMKFGLVLSGGGAKGAYEAGAIKAMGEMDVIEKVYGVSGTSVGALNTLVFAMDDVALMEELWENIGLMTVAALKVAEGDSRAIKDIVGKLHITAQMQGSEDTAVFTQNSLRELINKSCDFEKIRAHRAKLFACAYDINERHVKYFELKKLSDEEMTDAVLASAAIPHVYDPVEIEGHKFADGGINDPSYGVKNSDVTPLSPLQDEGHNRHPPEGAGNAGHRPHRPNAAHTHLSFKAAGADKGQRHNELYPLRHTRTLRHGLCGHVHRLGQASYEHYKRVNAAFTIKHAARPNNVGRRKARIVHLRLPVSFFIVKSVVEHGQCITLNSTKHTAVFMLHPFAISSARISQSAGSSSSEPDAVYAIMAMGRTISFAGKPSMNAISIAPSSPNTRANGSRKSTAAASIDCPPMLIFDNA